ncbi:MAG: iron chaperone [Gemmatimonadaceae bacterium]
MSVDDYLKGLPTEMRAALERLRKTIKAAAPNADEVISYGIPFYKHNGMLVGFSAAKEHCTFHIVSGELLRIHAAELAPFETGKGSIRFVPTKPLPPSLVTKIVKARVAENDGRAKKKVARPKSA